jgi:hypothetical protein
MRARGPCPFEQHGLRPSDVGVVPGAAGGPKGLVLGPLDRFIFGEWLPQSSQPSASGGRLHRCLAHGHRLPERSGGGIQRLEHDYIHQDYALAPGQKRPTAAHVSERFGQNLQAFYGGRWARCWAIDATSCTSSPRAGATCWGASTALRTPLGYLGAFLTNTVHRRAMGAWLERVVFSSAGRGAAVWHGRLPHAPGGA